MKKFALLFLLFLCIHGFAQDVPSIKLKTKTPYLGAGVSFSQTKDIAMSAEGGIWGINGSPTTYALTFDAATNLDSDQWSMWLGVKPYYYFWNKGKLDLYAYAAPKFQVYNHDEFTFLFEPALGANYNLSDHITVQYTFGAQIISTGGTVPFFLALSFAWLK